LHLYHTLFNDRYQCDAETEEHRKQDSDKWDVVAVVVTVEVTVCH